MTYFSQNDPRWRNIKIGQSNVTLGQKGCTIDCIADAASWFRSEEFGATPDVLARKLSFTQDGRIIWSSIGEYFESFKFEWRFYSYEEARILEALKNPNKVVLFNINGGAHWVFGLSKVPFTKSYRVSDPFPYPASKRFISASNIVGGAVLVRK